MLLQRQETGPYELFHQTLAAFWAKQTENLEEKKKLSEPASGPLAFLF